MMTNFQNVDEYGRREFIAHAAKACLGVGLMPMAGSYIHDSVKALTPGARPAAARHVIYLNMTFEEASKFIVSAGTSTGKN